MIEDQGVSVAKNKIPIKTKVVAWFMIVVGTLLVITYLIYSFVVGLQDSSAFTFLIFLMLIFVMPLCLSYLLPGILLLRKTMGAWTTAKIILFIDVAGVIIFRLIYSGLYFMLTDNDISSNQLSNFNWVAIVWAVTYIVPILVLIIDKENYLEMLRQREERRRI